MVDAVALLVAGVDLTEAAEALMASAEVEVALHPAFLEAELALEEVMASAEVVAKAQVEVKDLAVALLLVRTITMPEQPLDLPRDPVAPSRTTPHRTRDHPASAQAAMRPQLRTHEHSASHRTAHLFPPAPRSNNSKYSPPQAAHPPVLVISPYAALLSQSCLRAQQALIQPSHLSRRSSLVV